MDMGETLRAARERKGLSLDAIARTTKIGVPILRAIENNDIHGLPGGIFLRGFIRAYAREVGLDVEETLRRYVQEHVPPPLPGLGGTVEESPDESVVAGAGSWMNRRPAPETTAPGTTVVVILALGLLAYMTLRDPGPAMDAAVDQTVEAPIVLAAMADETGTTGLQEPAASAVPSDGLRLTIQATGPCWVSATVDGRIVVYRLMQAGERQTIEGGDVVLTVGDPATFTFAVNGGAGRSLGPAGRVVTVRMTENNYQEFLAQAP